MPLGALSALAALSMTEMSPKRTSPVDDSEYRKHMEAYRRDRQFDYGAHVGRYRKHIHDLALREQERKRLEEQRERERHFIDAAAAKRLRKQQKRLGK